MKKTAVILIAEDNQTNFELIMRNLQRTGITNEVQHFIDGRQTLDFIFENVDGPAHQHNKEYMLLLNTDIPKVDGVLDLQEVKEDVHDKFADVVDHRFYYFDSSDVDNALTKPGGIVEKTKAQVLAMIRSKLND